MPQEVSTMPPHLAGTPPHRPSSRSYPQDSVLSLRMGPGEAEPRPSPWLAHPPRSHGSRGSRTSRDGSRHSRDEAGNLLLPAETSDGPDQAPRRYQRASRHQEDHEDDLDHPSQSGDEQIHALYRLIDSELTEIEDDVQLALEQAGEAARLAKTAVTTAARTSTSIGRVKNDLQTLMRKLNKPERARAPQLRANNTLQEQVERVCQETDEALRARQQTNEYIHCQHSDVLTTEEHHLLNARTFRDEPRYSTRARATAVATPAGNPPSEDDSSSSSSSTNASGASRASQRANNAPAPRMTAPQSSRASQRANTAPAPCMTAPQSSRQSTSQHLTAGCGPHDHIEHMLSQAYRNPRLISKSAK